MTGDLNDVQQLALISLMLERDDAESKKVWENFKYMAIAAHPELTKTIMELDDNQEDKDGFARPLTEEEMADYQPISAEEITESLDILESFGLRMR